MDKRKRIIVISDPKMLTSHHKVVLKEETNIDILSINNIYNEVPIKYVYIDSVDFLIDIVESNIKFSQKYCFILHVKKLKKDLLLKGKNQLILQRFTMNNKSRKVDFPSEQEKYPTLVKSMMCLNYPEGELFYIIDTLDNESKKYLQEDIKTSTYFNIIPHTLISKKRIDRPEPLVENILVFGNDSTINEFDFKKLENTNIITAGVNRIWKKYECDYLYFLDPEIVDELMNSKYKSKKTTVILPLYFKQILKSKKESNNYGAYLKWLRENFHSVIEVCNESIPAHSLSWLILALQNNIFVQNKYCINFYIYGSSLVSKQINHFWDGDETVLNKKSKDYHDEIFSVYLKGFQTIKKFLQPFSHIFITDKNSALKDVFKSRDK